LAKTQDHYFCTLGDALLYKGFFNGLRGGCEKAFDIIQRTARNTFSDVGAEFPVSGVSYCEEDVPYLLMTSTNGDKSITRRYSSKYFTTVPELGLFNFLLLGDDNDRDHT
jgi:hypothetical protein